MFLEDSDSSIANNENTRSAASIADLDTLTYQNNENTSLKSLNINILQRKIFFKYNTCLQCSAPVKRLLSKRFNSIKCLLLTKVFCICKRYLKDTYFASSISDIIPEGILYLVSQKN